MKVWFVYAWHKYYPGAVDYDIQGSYETKEEAEEKKLQVIKENEDFPYDNVEVIDMSKWIIGDVDGPES